MTNNDEHLERLIVRNLHGELTEDESLELDRALIRDPEARLAMDEYARVESLAAAGLGAALCEDSVKGCGESSPGQISTGANRRPWHLSSRRLAPVAIAASIALAMIIPLGNDADPGKTVEQSREAVDVAKPVEPGGFYPTPDRVPMRRVGTGLRASHRSTARDVLGVMGKDGKTIYFLEVDRTRTTQYPSIGSKDKRVREDM